MKKIVVIGGIFAGMAFYLRGDVALLIGGLGVLGIALLTGILVGIHIWEGNTTPVRDFGWIGVLVNVMFGFFLVYTYVLLWRDLEGYIGRTAGFTSGFVLYIIHLYSSIWAWWTYRIKPSSVKSK